MADLPEPLTFDLYLAPELPSLHLSIPASIVSSLCSYPVKYLRYVAYCILGVGGAITTGGIQLSDEDDIPPGVYYYNWDSNGDASDEPLVLDVCAQASESRDVAEDNHTRESFRNDLAERDVSCIFTNAALSQCQRAHIVPFSRGDVGIEHIVNNRLHEDVANLTSINDTRNGMLLSNTIHPMFDAKKAVVLKTPNRVLSTSDIPANNSEIKLYGDVVYSRDPRYTLHWLHGTEQEQRIVANHTDAAFKNHSKIPKPASILLDYNYGVAALKWWGRGNDALLKNRERLRAEHDSLIVADVDSARQSQAEELVLRLWANTPAARTRREKQRGSGAMAYK
ncbi:hypothetical protein B0H15DRAFT_836667 [Mycena belliarum]|uniref:HNH nuclease domain-containing protein n=1 Tax=Mycena belliarum TaxID=1033014 RepID=A0AAD6XQC3_9AGAR|nr:hypothetical protein B0H15DRAFT_836667 [Mycena belliae]